MSKKSRKKSASSKAGEKAFKREAAATARSERAIQATIEATDRNPPKKSGKAMQAGARMYPVEFPKQHLKKPGLEADLKVAPMYDAPHYKGSGKLEGKVALITGA